MKAYTEDSLTEAINKLICELIGDLKLDVEVNSETESLSPNVKNEIYLIVREALTNIQLHAMATRAMVSIETFSDRIHLFVQDDGCGFELGSITKKPEGLIRIQESVKRLGGSYEMDTSDYADGGVAHWVHIPLPIVGGQKYIETTGISLAREGEVTYRREWKKMKQLMLG